MSGDPGQHGVDPDAVPDVIRGHGEGEGGHRTLPGGVQGGRTRTTRQGQGLGSALVEMGTSRADAAGVPCYLETAMDSNITFYRKRGFEVVGQADCFGHTLTGMVREPRQPAGLRDSRA